MTHTNVERDSKRYSTKSLFGDAHVRVKLNFNCGNNLLTKLSVAKSNWSWNWLDLCVWKISDILICVICAIPARSTDTCLPTRTHSLSNYKPGMPTIFGRNPLTFRCRFPHWPFWAAYKYLNAYRENLIKAYQKLPSQSFKAIMQVLATIFQHLGGGGAVDRKVERVKSSLLTCRSAKL